MHDIRFLGLVLTGTLCAAWGCTSDDPGAAGTGGAVGSGGVVSTGGAKPTGGSTLTGGSAPTGGSPPAPSGGSAPGPTGGAGVVAGSGGSGGSGGAIGGTSSSSGGSPTGGGTAGETAGSGGAIGGATGGTAPGGASPGGADGDPSTGPVTVKLDALKQKMEAFGINNNWAPAMTEADADAMFDVSKGLGISALRIGMKSDGGPFNGTACWDDIKKASARGVKIFIGTLWTPPAGYKTNGSENDGGHLKSEFYEQWATTIAAFPAKVKAGAGVDLYGMSPQNEVDFASCGRSEPCNGNYPTTLYTGEEMAAFVKVVGPKLKALSPPVKVIAPEASEWLHTWSKESACCSVPSGLPSSNPLMGKGYDYGHELAKDPAIWELVDIMGVHQYDTQVAETWPADVPVKKPVWQTEMSGVKWWPESGPSTDINNAVAVAGWIHNAITVGEASAWFWWWWKAQGDTNEGLLLANGTDTKRRYAFGNFSRFIRPGYQRVDIRGAIPAMVEMTAYKAEDGTVAVVAINKGDAATSFMINVSGGTAPATLTPWVTSATDNLASKSAVPVTDGAFTAELGAKTVTTYVGK